MRIFLLEQIYFQVCLVFMVAAMYILTLAKALAPYKQLSRSIFI